MRCLTQTGDSYQKFDMHAVIDLVEIAQKLEHFKIEIKLKSLDCDLTWARAELDKEFKSVTLGYAGSARFIK